MSTSSISAGPIDRRLSLPAAVITTMMSAMPAIETRGIALSSHSALPLRYLLKMRPAVIGMITILVISHIISNTLISTNAPASSFINNGVTNGAIIVDTAVMVMDNARFAFARYDITFDAMPFGEQPMRIIPAAISGGNPLTLASV